MVESLEATEQESLPSTVEDLEKRIADLEERCSELNDTVQILHGLEFPVLRIAADNSIVFLNNPFLEYADIEGIDETNVSKQSDDDGHGLGSASKQWKSDEETVLRLRASCEGRSLLDFIKREEHAKFENLKAQAKEKRLSGEHRFRIGVNDEFTFVSGTGKTAPTRLSMTYAKFYNAYQVSLIDITELSSIRDEMRRQSEEIMELSTPVIDVWDGVLLVPVIGVLDTQRGAQLTDRLLHAISESGAETAILDLTGVPMIDSAVANHLIDTVRSCKILGADVIVTGVSPTTAQTLIQLGIDFSDLHTRGSLRSGMKHAFKLRGKAAMSQGNRTRK